MRVGATTNLISSPKVGVKTFYITPSISFTPEYRSYIDYGVSQNLRPPSKFQRKLQNRLFIKLIDDGIWEFRVVAWILASDADEDFHLINIKNPGQFTAIKNGGLEWLGANGFKGNGTDAYIDTTWRPLQDGGGLYTQNNAGCSHHISITGGGGVDWGMGNSGLTQISAFSSSNGTIGSCRINQTATSDSFSNTDAVGFWHGRRFSSTSVDAHKDGVQIHTSSFTSTTLPNDVYMYLLARNRQTSVDGFSPKAITWFAAGQGIGTGHREMEMAAWMEYWTAII